MFRYLSIHNKYNLFKRLEFTAIIPIKLPAFSPTMSEGRIVNWTVKEG